MVTEFLGISRDIIEASSLPTSDYYTSYDEQVSCVGRLWATTFAHRMRPLPSQTPIWNYSILVYPEGFSSMNHPYIVWLERHIRVREFFESFPPPFYSRCEPNSGKDNELVSLNWIIMREGSYETLWDKKNKYKKKRGIFIWYTMANLTTLRFLGINMYRVNHPE